MYNSSYLVHFNKNHSKANGQFISGDGDSDGIVNDHAHRSKKHRTDGWYDYNRDVIRKEGRKKYYIDKDGNKHPLKFGEANTFGNLRLRMKYGSGRVDRISLSARSKEEDVKGHKRAATFNVVGAALNVGTLMRSKNYVSKAVMTYRLVKNLTNAAKNYSTAKIIDKEIADMPVEDLFKRHPDFDG